MIFDIYLGLIESTKLQTAVINKILDAYKLGIFLSCEINWKEAARFYLTVSWIKRILVKNSNIELTNARKIVDARNRIIHGYDTISDDVIWGIIIKHLPKLKTEVEELMYK